MVNTMRLVPASANFNIVGEASLSNISIDEWGGLAPLGPKYYIRFTHSHSSMKSASNFVILLQARTAAQNLWQPELANGALHVSNLSLCWSGSLHPLRRLTSNTTHHVRMSKGLGGSLLRFGVERRRNRLGNARMKGRCSAWNQHAVAALVASDGSALALAVPSTGPGEGGVGVERRRHGGSQRLSKSTSERVDNSLEMTAGNDNADRNDT